MPRLSFIDNLRILLITLVFFNHLSIIYGSPSGSFFGYQDGQQGMPGAAVYVIYQVIVQAFFMGLLFLISGYFTPPAYDRKGAKRFLGDRLVRLGIPLLIFAAFIGPELDYVVAEAQGRFAGSFLAFLPRLVIGSGGPETGPLWFVLALLFFAVGYLAWRTYSPNPIRARQFPTNRAIFAFALLLGAATFAVRIVFPGSAASRGPASGSARRS